MKCRGREKIRENKHQKIREAYGNHLAEYESKIMLLSLAEGFGWRWKRLQNISTEFTQMFYSEFESCCPDKQYIRTARGSYEADDSIRYADAALTMFHKSVRFLKSIGFEPDIEADFDFTDADLQKYRTSKNNYITLVRASWYARTGVRAAADYCLAFMSTLNQKYGFGAQRLGKWYRLFIEYYQPWVHGFIGAQSMEDDTIEKLMAEAERKLKEYGIELETDFSIVDCINVQKPTTDGKLPTIEEIKEKVNGTMY